MEEGATEGGQHDAADAAATASAGNIFDSASRVIEGLYGSRYTSGFHVDAANLKQLTAVRDELRGMMWPDSACLAYRAYALYLQGKTEYLLQGASGEVAAALLQRSVKLWPGNPEAWNCLAHCYWERGQLQDATNCFQRSLMEKPTPEAYRQLSKLKRQTAALGVGHAAAIVATIQDAQAAVALDERRAYSWHVLGTAFLTSHFAIARSQGGSGSGVKGGDKQGAPGALLRRALAAYRRAHDLGCTLPDNYYNCAVVHQFMQHYQQALVNFQEAEKLDSSLPASSQIHSIRSTVAQLSRSKANVTDEQRRAAVVRLQSVADSDALPDGYSRVALRDLPSCSCVSPSDDGLGQGLALVCRAVAAVDLGTASTAVYYAAVDSGGAVFLLGLNCFRPGAIHLLQVLTLLDPCLTRQHVSWEGDRAPPGSFYLEVAVIDDLNRVLADGKPLGTVAALEPSLGITWH